VRTNPLAFLLTFRTYSTWLHGDERGSVDVEHNIYRTPLIHFDPQRQAIAAQQMKHRALNLDEAMRAVVASAILDECRYRRWELIGRSVRSNHVHVVVGFAGVRPEIMMGKLKSRATRWLRERGLVSADIPVWVDGPGSRRYLWTPGQVAAAAAYVAEGQDVPH
jgi:REP element-mobilizing transposase RayT